MILLAVKASLALTVFAVGLQATSRDVTYLLRHPALLVRSFVSMNVAMPVLAFTLAVAFALHPVIKGVLVAVAISPVPPFLPSKLTKHGAHGSYAIGLLTMESLLAIVVVPATVWIIERVLGVSLDVSAITIAKIIATSVLLPLVIGVGVRRLWPGFAERVVKRVMTLGLVLLVGGIVPLLAGSWRAMLSLVGNGTLAAIVVMTVVGLIVGHTLGGPAMEDRMVLAMSTASRHPAIAIAVGTAMFPNEKLVAPAVLMALIVGVITAAPYDMWSKRIVAAKRPTLDSRSAGRGTGHQGTSLHAGHIRERRK